VSVHIDLAGDVDHAPLSESEFTPGVGSLTVDHLGVAIDGGPSAGGTIGKAHPKGLAGSDASGDGGLDSVDPRAGDAPDDEDEVLAGIVDELVLVGTVLAEPGLAVGGVGIDAQRVNAHGGESAGVSVGQGGISFLDVVVPAGMVVNGRMSVTHGGSTCLADCKGGQHQGLHCVAHLCIAGSCFPSRGLVKKSFRVFDSVGKGVISLFRGTISDRVFCCNESGNGRGRGSERAIA